MTNDPKPENLHQSYTIADVLDELRVEIVRAGWFSFAGPDPLVSLVLETMELPEATRVVSTVLEPDDPASYPEQTLAAALARMWQRALCIDAHARTPSTIDQDSAGARPRGPADAK